MGVIIRHTSDFHLPSNFSSNARSFTMLILSGISLLSLALVIVLCCKSKPKAKKKGTESVTGKSKREESKATGQAAGQSPPKDAVDQNQYGTMQICDGKMEASQLAPKQIVEQPKPAQPDKVGAGMYATMMGIEDKMKASKVSPASPAPMPKKAGSSREPTPAYLEMGPVPAKPKEEKVAAGQYATMHGIEPGALKASIVKKEEKVAPGLYGTMMGIDQKMVGSVRN